MTTTTIPPFNFIEGNTKGRWAHELTGRCVAFVGPNRQGKTARLDGIRLALTGRHPVGPHGSNLFELAPDNALVLRVALRGDEGLETSFAVETKGGKPRKPPDKPERKGALKLLEERPDSDQLFEHILPAQSMRDLIKLGSTLSREALFRRFGEITTIPEPRGLAEEQQKLWRAALEEVSAAHADTAETLAALSAHFRKKKLERGREVQALEKLLQEREVALASAAAGSEEIPALKAQIQAALAWERAAAARARKVEIEAAIESYRVRAKPYQDREAQAAAQEAEQQVARAALQAVVDEHRHGIAALEQRSSEIVAAYAAKAESERFMLNGGLWLLECLRRMHSETRDGHGACILCGNATDLDALEQQVAPRVAARRASVEALEAERDRELAAVEAERVRVRAALLSAESALSTWNAAREAERQSIAQEMYALRLEYERLRAARDENAAALEHVPAAYSGPPSDELNARLQSLEATETAARQLDAEALKCRELSLEQEVYRVLEDEASRELSALLKRTAEKANAAVNRYMPVGFRASLDLDNAQWRVYGTDKRPHGKKVISGSESGALTAALAQAWTEGLPARYVLLDDEDLAGFDPANLVLLLDALKRATEEGLITQVFLAWSRPSEIPENWGQKILIQEAAGFAALSTPGQPPHTNGTPVLL